MNNLTSKLFALALFTSSALFTITANAQKYPERPVKITVGFPPGTGPDILARVVGVKLSELTKQPVVIDNKPGAGAQIATQLVSKSPADGYNILLAEAGSISIAPAAFSKLQYDPTKELTGIAELAWADFMLVVPVNSPYKTLADMVNANKSGNSVLNFGTFGAGTPGHFGAVEFGSQAQVKVEPIHFRSTGDAVTALVSGDVAGAWVSTAVASAQVKGGKMRALATTGKARSALLPDVPTTAEAGMPKLNFSAWLGVLAPSGVPASVLDVLNKSLVQAVNSPEVKQKLIEVGFAVTGTTRADTEKMLKTEAVRWGGIVASSGFKGD
ncbi:tripartite tricarboxylate transporter substrate binding protein [Limnohabitans sp. 15K]|uniref:Bug family tripartite tricarboxylate transporter substrate binding protein n=1 Tax=Limnohabitans sp. 15K TaxID=1100706 RepID=UPI000C1E4A1A|nr:tripartite tricarboxylate transporter substrate binding protein [Limnohabitans sp. 15K]PIT79670.1 C4-dicarboxylate ABC transporter [Limnohabitans sp. 15K]